MTVPYVDGAADAAAQARRLLSAATRRDPRKVRDFWPRVLASPVQRREDWLQQPGRRLTILLGIVGRYTIPVTATLFQNALKHNRTGPDAPLHIRVRRDGDVPVVENDLRPGPSPSPSTGLGLTNLAERFRIATGRTIEWRVEGGRFVVRLPVLRGSAS